MDILVTGASGFVGQKLINELLNDNHQISALVRDRSNRLPLDVKQIEIDDLATLYDCQNDINDFAEIEDKVSGSIISINDDLNSSLDKKDAVIHMAARVHIMTDDATDSLNEFKRVNTYPSLYLAQQAARSGVKRFIFISSVKVNGEFTEKGKPFTENDDCCPSDPYAISKWEAEQGLMQIANATGMEVVIIRPPLVYGPGVKGNFARMLSWVSKGLPLPLGKIRNKRSMLALENLVSFIIRCLVHPGAANQVFLLSDGEDISTTELIQKLARAQGIKARLLPIPVSWMKAVARLMRKKEISERLFSSLLVDNRKARTLLDWSPVVSMEQQLIKMVRRQSEQVTDL